MLTSQQYFKKIILTLLSNICLSISKPISNVGNFFYSKHVKYLHTVQRISGLR